MDSDSPSGGPSDIDNNHVIEEPEISPIFKLIDGSASRSVMDDLLAHYYSSLEIWYLRVITDKV